MMLRVVISGMYLVCVHFVVAQVQIHSIVEPLRGRTDTSDIYERYEFPHIEGVSSSVSDNINAHLLFEMLDIERDSVKRSIFENVWGSNELPMPSLTFLQYTVNHNSRNILSLDISTEGCGAYCEGYTRHFNYDIRSGSAIPFDALFTNEGLRVINDSIVKWKRNDITAQIKLLYNTKPFEEDSIRNIEAIEMYNYCLEDFSEAYFGDAQYQKYRITALGINIFQSRCSAHVNRDLDDLGEFEYKLNVNEYRKYLSPYGQNLFNFKK